jgi:Lrp/AsnC family leucine-responsive transcriptional regulator
MSNQPASPPSFPIPATKLDDLDRRITELLRLNSRMSYTDISKEVGISRVGVQARVNALIENGTLERFTVIVNSEKIGLNVSAFFHVEVEPHRLSEVAQRLSDEPAVTALHHMTGPSKLHMHAVFANMPDMEAFLQERLYNMPGIVGVESQLLIKKYKY